MTTSAPGSRVDALEERYRVRFAGHPRVSRDPDELRTIVAELEAVLPDADAALSERIGQLLGMYRGEVDAIVSARAVPFAVLAARLRLWTDLSFSRYQRMFAGKDRRTRDVSVLDEIVTDLTRIRGEMAKVHPQAPALGLDQAIAQIDRALEVYQRESSEIRAIRRTGTPAEQGSRYAQLANEQFHTYTRLFANQARVSRHPPTLSRILAALEDIRRGMHGLAAAGFADPANARNLGIVDDRLKAFRQELAAIQVAVSGATRANRITALASAANDVFAAYRDQYAGKSRSTADPDGITALFERLWPVAREMDALDQHDDDDDGDDDPNERNLRLVTDNLRMYAREYDAIVTARAGG